MNPVDGRVAPPAVHFQEHYFAAMYGQRPAAWVSLEQQQARQGEAGIKHEAVPTTFSLDHGVCFSELLVLGRANSHVTFIGDAALSEAFKARVYAQVDADEDVDVNVRINAASPRFNTSAALAGEDRRRHAGIARADDNHVIGFLGRSGLRRRAGYGDSGCRTADPAKQRAFG